MPFNLIGFTEKELGYTLKERLLTLIAIKDHFSEIGWFPNIHIFGGLEQKILLLYFAAGATVFDGLSWQKIRYYRNSTLHCSEKYLINYTEADNKLLMMCENLRFLQSLETKMESIIATNNMNDIRSKLKNVLLSESNMYINDIIEHLGVF